MRKTLRGELVIHEMGGVSWVGWGGPVGREFWVNWRVGV